MWVRTKACVGERKGRAMRGIYERMLDLENGHVRVRGGANSSPESTLHYPRRWFMDYYLLIFLIKQYKIKVFWRFMHNFEK